MKMVEVRCRLWLSN